MKRMIPLVVCAAWACSDTSSARAVRIEIAPISATVQVGQATQFNAVARTASGASVPNLPAIEWSISPADVATIEQSGNVTGLKAGSASVVASLSSLNLSATAALTVTAAPLNFTLSVTRSQGGGGHVTSTPAGIDCDFAAGSATTPCSHAFASGTLVTLSASPHADSTFLGFSGACSGAAACALTIAADANVNAQFQLNQQSGTVAIGFAGTGGGSVSSAPGGISCHPNCSSSFAVGSSVTLTATPDGSSTFAGWSGGTCASANPCTFSVSPGTTTITATFSPATASSYALAVTPSDLAGGEIVSTPAGIDCGAGHSACSAQFAAGSSVSLSQTAAALYGFAGWGGACSGTGACSVQMNGAQTVSVAYTAPGTISVTVAGTGAVVSTPAGINCASGTCSAQFSAGTAVSLAPTAGLHAFFSGWSGGCNGSGACSVTAQAGQTSSVTATFGATWALTVTVAGSGSVAQQGGAFTCASGSCTQEFNAGTAVTLVATPQGGLSFAGWGGDCSGTGNCVLTMSAAHEVSAAFVPLHTLTITPSPLGSVSSSNSAISACTTGSGTCTAQIPEGTTVHLSATPSGQAFFVSWSGACEGTAPTCDVTLSGDETAAAEFGDFSLALGVVNGVFSEVAGETRTLSVTVTPAPGSADLVVDLSATGLPTGVTATFADDGASVALAAAASALLGQFPVTLTAAVGAHTRSQQFLLEVRSPLVLVNPRGLDLDFDSGDLLVIEGESASRLVRVNTSTKEVVQTIANFANCCFAAHDVKVEQGAGTALVTYDNVLARVELATGAVTTLSTLHQPLGISLEQGGLTALVSDCGVTNDCNNAGRLLRVTLAGGAQAQVSSSITALRYPTSVAVEPDGAHAVVAELGRGLSRVNLSSHNGTVVNAGLAGNANSVVVEDAAHALVGTDNGIVFRVSIQYGMASWVARPGGNLSGLALDQGGGDLFASMQQQGRVAGIAVPNLVEVLAPSPVNPADPLDSVNGLAIEADGQHVIVADSCQGGACGPGVNGQIGRLDRVTLATGDVAALTTALRSPYGVQLESGGATALVAEQAGNALTRVTLAGGALATVSQQPSDTNPLALLLYGTGQVIESGLGFNAPFLKSVLLSSGSAVTLTNGGPFPCCNAPWQMQLTSGGDGFFFARRNGIAAGDPNGSPNQASTTGQLQLYEFESSSLTDAITGLDQPSAVGVQAAAVIVGENGSASSGGRLLRADPATGRYDVISSGLFLADNGNSFPPRFLELEASGNTALVTSGNHVMRASLVEPQFIYTRFSGPYESPQGLALEAAGTALITTCGVPYVVDCTTNGSLLRIVTDFGSPNLGAPTLMASSLNFPHAVAVEDATHALLTDCGLVNASGGCSSNGRIRRVDLGTHAVTNVATQLNDPRCITVRGDGTALVCETGAGLLDSINLASGEKTALASGLSGLNQIFVEASGTTAVVAYGGALGRVNLANGHVTPIWANPRGGSLHFTTSDGVTALVALGGTSFDGALLQVNLQSGGVDLLQPTFFDLADSIVALPGGAGFWVTEARPRTGGLFFLSYSN